MNKYLSLLETIKEKGTYKPAARAGMPGTQSLFGYQFRHNLQEGFPLLTTKKMFWKGVVIELLWFLKGDTNIKYLVDNGVNIWNEDAYNYYKKLYPESDVAMKDFLTYAQGGLELGDGYKWGDCGFQYGKVWRNWVNSDYPKKDWQEYKVDQIKNLIEGLKNNPESRRHIVTAIDPAHDTDLALYWCHAMFQFNCRPLTVEERKKMVWERDENTFTKENPHDDLDQMGIPKYYLDCQLYQRSADVFLGVPFNIASYALLTHIIAKICNMVPGEFIHTFGDVHIYDNHKEQVDEQLKRTPGILPKLKIKDEGNDWAAISNVDFDFIKLMDVDDFVLENYNPQSSIKAELSTGLNKI